MVRRQSINAFVLLWVVSPKVALGVLKAELSTACHVGNLDSLRRVEVVARVLGVLLHQAG